MIIVIPSYQPGKALIDLVDALAGARVVVVDDGSGPDYAAIFAMVAARGAEVITHSVNHGKGAALKTGFAHVARTAPDQAVVCADSDGQHGSHARRHGHADADARAGWQAALSAARAGVRSWRHDDVMDERSGMKIRSPG